MPCVLTKNERDHNIVLHKHDNHSTKPSLKRKQKNQFMVLGFYEFVRYSSCGKAIQFSNLCFSIERQICTHISRRTETLCTHV